MSHDQSTQTVLDDRRSVSELLQFVLLFGFAVSITLGSVWFGAAQLTDLTGNQQVGKATDEMVGLQETQHQIARDVPLRTGAVTLPDGSLRYGKSDEVHVTVEATDSTGSTVSHDFDIQPIYLTIDDTDIVLEGGAVIYGTKDGSSMQSDPLFNIADNRSTLQFINTFQAGGSDQVGGSGNMVDVVNYRSNRDAIQMDPVVGGSEADATVTVTVETPRYRAWANYFEQHGSVTVLSVDESAEKVKAEFQTKEILSSEIKTAVKFE
jgi:hypothetical protein